MGVILTVENKITSLQEDNAKKLEAMRLTVDEKLQETLERIVNEGSGGLICIIL